MGHILNLTQHESTAEQVAAGVDHVTSQGELDFLLDALTFQSLEATQEIQARARALAKLAKRRGYTMAMIGGAPYLMTALTRELKSRGIQPVFSYSARESVEAVQEDGTVRKTSIFRHQGFVEG